MVIRDDIGRNHLEDLGIDGGIILEMHPWKIVWENVNWLHLSQDRVQWRTLENTVMKFQVS
jgi:hypothetical protein